MKPTKNSAGCPITTAVLHLISSVGLIIMCAALCISSIGIIMLPFLLPIGIIAAVMGVAAFWGFIIQLTCAVCVIVTSVFGKRKLCALFCGLTLIADLPAFGVGLTCSIAQLTQIQPDAAAIALFVITVAVTLLSLAGGICAVITLVKNLKYRPIP